MERSEVISQDARRTTMHQAERLDATSSAPHALSAISEADVREDEERRRQLVTLGLEVALAVLLTVAARIWGWAREERARVRVSRQLRRRVPAT